MNAAYARLKSRFARMALVGEAGAVLHWDASAMMPPGGGAARAAARRRPARVTAPA